MMQSIRLPTLRWEYSSATQPWPYRRVQLPEMVSIQVHAPEVEDRFMPGHWEGDFIKGAGNKSSAGVLVECTSRLAPLARIEDATAAFGAG
jgi:IS30 family transposase